jgi:hypothetical protein
LSLPCAKLSDVLPFVGQARCAWLASGRDHLITVFWVYSVKWEGSNFSCFDSFLFALSDFELIPSFVQSVCDCEASGVHAYA